MKEALSKIVKEQDVEGINEDMQDLVERLGKLKNQSIEEISEQTKSLSSVLSSLKDKESIKSITYYTRRHPCVMLGSAFGLGFLISCLIKKK